MLMKKLVHYLEHKVFKHAFTLPYNYTFNVHLVRVELKI